MLGPNITGGYIPVIARGEGLFARLGVTEEEYQGCFYTSAKSSYTIFTPQILISSDQKPAGIFFSASLSASVYGSNNSVQPSSNVVQYLIKY